MNKKITLLLLGLFAVACNAKSANAFTSPFSLDNTDFTVSPSSRGLNNAAGNSAINTTATPGFGGQFDAANGNTFLLLGATDTSSAIDGVNNTNLVDDNNSFAVSDTINIDQTNIDAGAINFKFDYSFQGTDDTLDSFFVQLRPKSGTSGSNQTLVSRTNYGTGTVDESIDITGFSTGDYELRIILNEANGDNEYSAAGFDNVTVKNVPFGVAPNTGILILGGLYAGSKYLKRRKMSS